MKKFKKMMALMLAVLSVCSLCACAAKTETASSEQQSAAETTAATETAADTNEDASQEEATEAAEENAVGEKIKAIQDAGVLVVGTSADYPPYEFHTQIDGEDTIVGFDMAIAQYFADSLGVELKIVDMSFDSLLISLSQGDFDLVMAGLTPDEERKKAVDFTDVFYRNKQIVLIRKEDEEVFKTTEDLAGHKGAVQTGTVQAEIANELIGEENTVGLVKFQDQIMELKTGKVDMVFTNSLVGAGYAAQNDDIMVQDVGIEYEDKGFAGAVQKGNEDLLEYLNGVIAEMQEQGLIQQYIAEAQVLAGMEE